MNKIRVIERSMSCQSYGAWSLVPILGVPLAVTALRRARQVRAEAGNEWNPARPQLVRGFVFALLGFVIGLIAFAATVLMTWNALLAVDWR